MSDTPPVSDPSAPLTDAAREEVGRIAEWCQGQRDHSERMAAAQIRVVWILLLGGLVLLLVLPRVLQWIDFFGKEDSLPPEILLSFDDTQKSIESNRTDMVSELAAAEMALRSVEEELAKTDGGIEATEMRLRDLLEPPLGVWRNAFIAPAEWDGYRILRLKRLSDSVVAAVGQAQGGESGEPIASGIVLTKGITGPWDVSLPRWQDEPITAVTDIVLGKTHRFLVAAETRRGTVLLGSDDRSNWQLVWQDDKNREISLRGLARDSNDLIVAVGQIIAPPTGALAAPNTPFLMVTRDGAEWNEIELPNDLPDPIGALGAVIAVGDEFYAAGSVGSFGVYHIVLGTSADGQNWTWDYHPFSLSNFVPSPLAIVQLFANESDQVFADVGGQMFTFEQDARSWIAFDKNLPPGIWHYVPLKNGETLAVNSGGARNQLNRVMLQRLGDDTTVEAAIEGPTEFLSGSVFSGLELSAEEVLIGGDGIFLQSMGPWERGDFLRRVMEDPQLPDGRYVLFEASPQDDPGRFTGLLSNLREARGLRSTQEANRVAREDVANAARQTLARQEAVKRDFETLADELKLSLRQAEPSRQLAQIATRLAVIGLLIYLVQIVVNRYRYLQRLAGFYQARAQAFRLLAASPDAALLRGVSLADVTAMLSPDAIGFDKSAEPPTGQMVSLLQAGLKRG